MALLGSLIRAATPTVVGNQDSIIADAVRRAGGRYFRPTQTMQISAVYRSIRILADVIAALPIDILAEQTYPDGSKTDVTIKPPALSAIWRRPNPEVNRFVFWNTVAGHLVATGNAYMWVDPAPTVGAEPRSPLAFWPIQPELVRVGRGPDHKKIYTVLAQGEQVVQKDWIDGGNIVHLQGFGSDGLIGLSPVELGASTFSNAYDAGTRAAAYLRNSAHPQGGYLTSEQVLSADQAREASEMWDAYHGGPENAGRTAVLGRGTKWMSFVLNPKDAQLLESRSFEVEEISRWFGVPLHLLSSHTKDTSWGSGLFEQNRALLVFTVDPLLVNIELTISDELIWRTDQKAVFVRDSLLRPNPLERAQYYAILRQNGVINADEWRAKEGMAPIPGGSGQAYGNPNTTAGA